MKKLKVAIIGSCTSAYTSKLVHYLSNTPNIDLHLIALGSKDDNVRQGNFNMHIVKERRPLPLFVFTTLPSIRRKLVEMNPDIVHAVQQADYSLAAVTVRDRFPTLLTVVGIIAKEYKFYANYQGISKICRYAYVNLVEKRREKYLLSKIPNLIAESSHNRDIIAQMTNSKVLVIPDGIELELIQKIQVDSNKKLDIFCIGGLHPGKGIDLLIKAVPTIAESILNFRLAVAGRGHQENGLRNLVKKLSLEEHVEFLGFVSEEEKFQYFKSCKLAVVPSRWDFSPIAIYEAMACGKPVVASTNTNSQILVDGETGFLFESEDVQSLASKALILLREDELREQMGKTALERAKECDWSKVVERHVDVYEQVIADFHGRKTEE